MKICKTVRDLISLIEENSLTELGLNYITLTGSKYDDARGEVLSQLINMNIDIETNYSMAFELNLRTLSLEESKAIGEALKKNYCLKKFTLKRIIINYETLKPILNGLEYSDSIEQLNIEDVSFDAITLGAVCEYISSNTRLKTLILDRSCKNDAGTSMLTYALDSNFILTNIYIGPYKDEKINAILERNKEILIKSKSLITKIHDNFFDNFSEYHSYYESINQNLLYSNFLKTIRNVADDSAIKKSDLNSLSNFVNKVLHKSFSFLLPSILSAEEYVNEIDELPNKIVLKCEYFIKYPHFFYPIEKISTLEFKQFYTNFCSVYLKNFIPYHGISKNKQLIAGKQKVWDSKSEDKNKNDIDDKLVDPFPIFELPPGVLNLVFKYVVLGEGINHGESKIKDSEHNNEVQLIEHEISDNCL